MIHHMPYIISFLGYNPCKTERKTLGGKIKNYRLLKGLSHKKLGKILRVDASTIASWEKNESKPSFTSLNKLKKCFAGVSRELQSL